MFCKNCGKQIDENAKFCENCGASMHGNAETASNEKSGQVDVSIRTVPVKKSINKTLLITIIAVISALIIGGAGVILFDNYNQKKSEESIQAVQEAYFEFLPEMTVGDLLYEYYGEKNWAYNDDNVVEFWGTNQKDKSGLALNFDSVKADNTVEVTYRMYHNENETAHSISEEEFEEYIISLYAQLDDSYQNVNETTQPATEQITTTKSTTTTSVKKETESESELSANYIAYSVVVNTFDSAVEIEYTNSLTYRQYYLYDINKDGIYELIVHVGAGEADAVMEFYSLDENGELLELGEIGGGHTWLSEKDGNLYTNFGHQGIQKVQSINMMEDLGSWILLWDTVFEKEGLSDYTTYGTAIQGYDISDKSAIEALCPKKLLEDKPHINAYVKTYSLSGHDGAKIRLYLDGDFSGVSVQIHNQEYTSEIEFYSIEDFDDYIEMNFNPLAQPPSVAYVTPYSDSGVPGDVITCDIPSEVSGTISTGSISYPVNNKKGQINCHGGTVAGFTTDYVVNGGTAQKVRDSLGDTWHVTAKNACDNYGTTWYELWDSDDGDYYGWVDSNYIDFY